MIKASWLDSWTIKSQSPSATLILLLLGAICVEAMDGCPDFCRWFSQLQFPSHQQVVPLDLSLQGFLTHMLETLKLIDLTIRLCGQFK